MASVGRATGGWLRQVRGLFRLGTVGGLSDGDLIARFVSRGGEDSEAAFEALIHRHGPMVLRVCRRVLRDSQDAEDAFQATFLVLAHQGRLDPASGLGRELALRRLAAGRRAGPARRRASTQR